LRIEVLRISDNLLLFLGNEHLCPSFDLLHHILGLLLFILLRHSFFEDLLEVVFIMLEALGEGDREFHLDVDSFIDVSFSQQIQVFPLHCLALLVVFEKVFKHFQSLLVLSKVLQHITNIH